MYFQMSEEEDYSSDSDQSDEDYNPDENNSDVPSEVDSDGDPESGEEDVKQTKTLNKRKKKSRDAPPKRKSRRYGRSVADAEAEEQFNEPEETKSEEAKPEENEDDDDKRHADALWADFLGSTSDGVSDERPPPKTEPEEPVTKTENETRTSSSNGQSSKQRKIKDDLDEEPAPKKRTITEIFEFAGEKVEVKKVVDVDQNQTSAKTDLAGRKSDTSRGGIRRGVGEGLGSILDQLGKPKQITTLEKTKIDWSTFKEKEGIDEELQTFNKGKEGYLERQDFLQRTDLRQFEIEKSQRTTARRK